MQVIPDQREDPEGNASQHAGECPGVPPFSPAGDCQQSGGHQYGRDNYQVAEKAQSDDSTPEKKEYRTLRAYSWFFRRSERQPGAQGESQRAKEKNSGA